MLLLALPPVGFGEKEAEMPNPVADFPWIYSRVAATKQVSAAKCVLHNITINGLTTAGDCTVYDSPDNSGTVIAVLHLDPTTSISVQPITLNYDVECLVGLYLEFDQNLEADLTVSYM